MRVCAVFLRFGSACVCTVQDAHLCVHKVFVLFSMYSVHPCVLHLVCVLSVCASVCDIVCVCAARR